MSVIDLQDKLQVDKFHQWFCYSGIRNSLRLAIDYWKLQEYNMAMVEANNCVECGAEAIRRCRCPRGERSCVNGHTWHVCVVCRKVAKGVADHKVPIDKCTCNRA